MIAQSLPAAPTPAPPQPTLLTTRFGEVAYRAEAELRFPLGLPGFEGVDRFVLCPLPGTSGAFQLLHGVAEAPIDLVVVPHENVAGRADPADIEALRASLDIPVEDLLVLYIVTLPMPGSPPAVQVNLRAPIFVDVARRLAVQMVLADSRYGFNALLRAA